MGMYRQRMERGVNRRQGRAINAEERDRKHRWAAPGAARVTDPKRGTVVVPCQSPFAAILCAAEVWGCNWVEVLGSEVWLAHPEDQVAKMPYII